jgi:hypothetical protein
LISSGVSSLGELTSEGSVLLQEDTNSIQYHKGFSGYQPFQVVKW